MRKMMNKKGFTLVELMIVVVILGILVAIAVPIYSSVTKNAKKKACASNIRVIKGNLETYLTTGAADGGAFATTAAISNAANMNSNADFKKLFDGGSVPVCKTNDKPYTITLTEADGVVNYTVVCSDSNCPINVKP